MLAFRKDPSSLDRGLERPDDPIFCGDTGTTRKTSALRIYDTFRRRTVLRLWSVAALAVAAWSGLAGPGGAGSIQDAANASGQIQAVARIGVAPFAFRAIDDATPAARVVSDVTVLDGFAGILPLRLSAQGKSFSYRLNGGSWLDAAYGNVTLYVDAGTTLELAITAPAHGESTTVSSTIEGLTATWRVSSPEPLPAGCGGGEERVWLEAAAICVAAIPAGTYPSGVEIEARDKTAPGLGAITLVCSNGRWTEPAGAARSCTP